ncbi:MAG: hypothetical protein BGP04_16090 [Rhizobiales bacterium 62-17]|nr:DUF1850 domain-containing protein [Hyphomicrobiales bacterium]OJY03280.1 MAG: hypothetical protein BGP04_16090 [Rhizobiales bacterium 62-17]
MSINLCIVSGATITKVAALTFTLSWQHSVQKTEWTETWQVTPTALELVEARVEGTGAGMEPPEGSVFDGRFWRWKPTIPPLPEVRLSRSDAVPQGWRLCTADSCRPVASAVDHADVVILKPCAD